MTDIFYIYPTYNINTLLISKILRTSLSKRIWGTMFTHFIFCSILTKETRKAIYYICRAAFYLLAMENPMYFLIVQLNHSSAPCNCNYSTSTLGIIRIVSAKNKKISYVNILKVKRSVKFRTFFNVCAKNFRFEFWPRVVRVNFLKNFEMCIFQTRS